MTQTDSEQAFLDDITANPDDDGLRLIYADWLDEQGNRYADLIRIMVEHADLNQYPHEHYYSLSRDCQDPVCVLVREGRKLFMSEAINLWHFVPWAPKDWTITASAKIAFRVGSKEGEQDIWHHFYRGMIEKITCTAEDWITHADSITARHPIRRVKLTDVPSELFWCDDDPDSIELSTIDHRFGELTDNADVALWLYANDILAALANDWPTITFELPGD